MEKYKYIYMMDSYRNYIDVLRNILKNVNNEEFEDMVKTY